MSDLVPQQPPEVDVERVTRLFVGLGAQEDSAGVMARQLLKRAIQISKERNLSHLEAVEMLLKQVIAARS